MNPPRVFLSFRAMVFHPLRLSCWLWAFFWVALLTAFPPSARTAMLWYANFENYSAGDSVTFNSTGDDNTFSALINEGTNAVTTATVTAATGGMQSNFMTFKRVSSDAGSGFSGFRQDKIASIADGGIAVLSLDINKQSGETGPVLQTQGLSSNQGVTEPAGNLTYASGLSRLTFVVNRSGGTLLLPGTLGTLADDAIAVYIRSSSGTYSGLVTTSISSSTGSLAGFQSRMYMSDSRSLGYDNFGYWDSATDTFGGTNVLELAAGTVIPEPSAVALLVCGLGGVAAIHRTRRRQPLRTL